MSCSGIQEPFRTVRRTRGLCNIFLKWRLCGLHKMRLKILCRSYCLTLQIILKVPARLSCMTPFQTDLTDFIFSWVERPLCGLRKSRPGLWIMRLRVLVWKVGLGLRVFGLKGLRFLSEFVTGTWIISGTWSRPRVGEKGSCVVCCRERGGNRPHMCTEQSFVRSKKWTELGERDRVLAGIDGYYKGVVVRSQATENVAYKLRVRDRFSCCRKLISKVLIFSKKSLQDWPPLVVDWRSRRISMILAEETAE